MATDARALARLGLVQAEPEHVGRALRVGDAQASVRSEGVALPRATLPSVLRRNRARATRHDNDGGDAGEPETLLQRWIARRREGEQLTETQRRALTDPIVRHVARGAGFGPPVRAVPHSRASAAGCGHADAIPELSAPLFMASERPAELAERKAPYGLQMGGKSRQEMLRSIRRYQRNTSLPARCRYESCAVVGSSGNLRRAGLGARIDAHDAVIRINAAPTSGHERDVGARTTLRVHNSEKPFFLASLGVPELQLVICHMGWIGSCQHQAFDGTLTSRIAYINPIFYEQLWALLGRPRGKQTPSTGLLGIALALGLCGRVSLYGFGATGAGSAGVCRHYWHCVGFEDEARYHDLAHTFHDWYAEERLRHMWIDAGIVVDGVAAARKPASRAGGAARRGARRNGSAWEQLRPLWRRSVGALERFRRDPSTEAAVRRAKRGPVKGPRATDQTADQIVARWARQTDVKARPAGRGLGAGAGA